MKPIIIYLIIINIIAVLVFAVDKAKAKNQKQRVPEKILHLLELLGGVFGILITMYVIHHKSSKWQYYIITYIILIAWILSLQYFKVSLF
jgi:uncharacterized membrane protein YsdA (DUF1294 family)